MMKARDITDCNICPVGIHECIQWMRGNTPNMYVNDPPCEYWNDNDEITGELPENGLNALIAAGGWSG
jgi:hypothetical protein